MADLHAQVDALRAALDELGPMVPADLVRRARGVAERVERRLGFLGETVVVALAGGTGSGKSSLLNAIAGTRVVEAGVLRPTTEHPVAWVPAGGESSLVALLADLGITDLRFQSRLPRVAVVDLPDLDSVRLEHRRLVDDLVTRVDAVVWVLDPTKYNDALVHEDYLRPMRAHAGQFLVVLNQVDRLTRDERREVLADLRATLAESGLGEVPVLAVAADPDEGRPRHLEELLRELVARFRSKQVARDRLAVDLRAAAEELLEVVGDRTSLPDRAEVFARLAETVASGVVDDAVVGRAGDVGARVAARAAGGPVGLVGGAVRSSPVGRVLGLARDAPLDLRILPSASQPTARLAPATALQHWITDTSVAVGGALGRQLRANAGDTEELVADVTSEARAAVDQQARIESRGWWRAVGVVRSVLVLVVVGVVAWAWSDPTVLAPGRLPVPVLATLAAVGAWVGLGCAARASGRRTGEELALAQRSSIVLAARESLEFRLGRPLDDLVATRERLHDRLEPLVGPSRADGGDTRVGHRDDS